MNRAEAVKTLAADKRHQGNDGRTKEEKGNEQVGRGDGLAFSELTARTRKTITGAAGALEQIWRPD